MLYSDFPAAFSEDIKTAVTLLKKAGCTEIYLFGSIQNGTFNADSDIDIAVKGLKPENFFQIYGELLIALKHNIDLIDIDIQTDFGQLLIKTGELKRVA
jgi:predicted nucleotidyltransferase